MNNSKLKSLILECLNEVLTDQVFDQLRYNISSRTMVGEKWSKLVYGLEGLYEELKDFESMYVTGISQEGKPANIQYSIKKVEEMVEVLNNIKSTVMSVDVIQRKDMGS
jgi:hypothetical protein